MRTTIDIDRELVKEAMTATGTQTIRDAVDHALRDIVNRQRRMAALEYFKGRYPDFEAPEDKPLE